jgi:hypothetical protein
MARALPFVARAPLQPHLLHRIKASCPSLTLFFILVPVSINVKYRSSLILSALNFQVLLTHAPCVTSLYCSHIFRIACSKMWSKQLLLLSAVALLSSSVVNTVSATSVITPAPAVGLAPRATAAESSTAATDATSTKRITINLNGSKATKTIEIKLPSATCIQTITPDKNGYVPPGTCHALYNYYPSFGAAITTSVIFGILLAGHVVEASLYKTGFCWVIIVGTAWETIAFALRAFSTRHQQSSGLALMSQLFVLLAPLCEFTSTKRRHVNNLICD